MTSGEFVLVGTRSEFRPDYGSGRVLVLRMSSGAKVPFGTSNARRMASGIIRTAGALKQSQTR